ncbi:MAG: hypothetical protein U0L49_03460 [Eubacterium sp.]|nr:hypothetical protein [Eubacterium sp.]
MKVKRILTVIIILLCAAIGSGIFFLVRQNRKQTEAEEQVTLASLPVIHTIVSGKEVNRMQGTLTKLQDRADRSPLTPVGTDRTISFELDPQDAPVTGAAYELHDLTDGSIMENGTIGKLDRDEDGIEKGSVTLKNTIVKGREYGLCFMISLEGDRKAYYYTRLSQTGSNQYNSYIDYTLDFARKCLNKDNTEYISKELFVDTTKYRVSLQSMDIYSSSDQVTWSDLEPALASQPEVEIEEANDVTCCLSLRYRISREADNGTTEFFQVKDFYRMRNAQGSIILLDFYRNTERLFDFNEQGTITDDDINLGFQGDGIQYIADENAVDVAFTVNGNIWVYNRENNEIVRAFGFGKTEDKESFDDHGIVMQDYNNDDGTFDFLVYGYFPSGSHIGQNGIAVYRYNKTNNRTIEKYFLSLPVGFERMKADLSHLLYYDAEGKNLYLYLNHEILKADMEASSIEVLQAGVSEDALVASDSGASAAWTNAAGAYDGTEATFMDFSTGKSRKITADEGSFIRVLDFMNEDLVYGLGNSSDIISDSLGDQQAGLYRIDIVNHGGEQLENYQRDGLYITKTTKDDGYLELELSEKTSASYNMVSTDHIMKNSSDDEIVTLTSDTVGEKTLSGAGNARTDDRAIRTADVDPAPADDYGENKADWPKEETGHFYVYAKGNLMSILASPAEAVSLANEWNGSVLDDSAHYVWERGVWSSNTVLNPENFDFDPDQVSLDTQAASEILGDSHEILNMTGNTREAMNYYISRGWPVWASYNGGTVCILGYDIYNIWIYDASDEEDQVKAIAYEDADPTLKAEGFRFMTYIDK